jgi:hypothetical protein
MCKDDATVIIEPNEILTTIVIDNNCEEVTIIASGLGERGPQGPQGAQGPQGPIGPQGPQGNPGTTTKKTSELINDGDDGVNPFITLQDVPSVDAIPTDGSNNAVSSNGVFDELATKQNSLGFTAENIANKSIDVSADRLSNTKYPSVKSVVDYVGSLGFITNVISALGYTPENLANKSTNVITDQASNNKYPSVKSVYDWAINAFTTQAWVNSQGFITNVITSLGFTPENVANKSTNVVADQTSNTRYPSVKSVFDFALAKGFPSFSFKANNTSTENAPAQDIYFQQSGKQTYSGTVTWAGTTSPSGTTNHSFNWIRVGNMVTLNITLVYGTAGTANTGAIVPLLSSMPTPIIPDGLSASLRYIYPAYGKMSLADTSITTAASEVAMRINTGFDGYEFVITQGSTGAKTLKITCQYFTA